MDDQIPAVIHGCGGLSVTVAGHGDDVDLRRVDLTSDVSVNVMLASKDAVVFPEILFRRTASGSIAVIRSADPVITGQPGGAP
jgi:hypothetical protein